MTVHKKTGVIGLATLCVFVIAYFPVLKILATIWANSDEYSHAFLTIPIIFYMVWLKRKELRAIPVSFSSLGLVTVCCSSGLYLFAMLTEVNTLIFLSFFLAVMGTVIYLVGTGVLKYLITPILLFIMLIPIPEQILPQLTFPLQLKVSEVSEFIIRLFGVPLFREGNIMNLPERSFEVVEACSGLRSVITLMTLSVIMGYFMLKRNSSKIILLATSIPIAIIVNIIRVTAMVLLFHFWKLDLSAESYHTMSGMVVFCLALLLLLILQKSLESWENKAK